MAMVITMYDNTNLNVEGGGYATVNVSVVMCKAVNVMCKTVTVR